MRHPEFISGSTIRYGNFPDLKDPEPSSGRRSVQKSPLEVLLDVSIRQFNKINFSARWKHLTPQIKLLDRFLRFGRKDDQVE